MTSNNMFYFNQTVMGHSHAVKNRPCQDASGSFCDERTRYRIIAVADGHGDSACMRSDRGSKFAVSVALNSLKELAEYCLSDENAYRMLFSETARRRSIRNLTDAICANWSMFVADDLASDPLSDDELNMAGHAADGYLRGEHIERIYGTTLIAALLIRNVLLVVHQGDGRCIVMYEDGSYDQPVPWDESCIGNVTSSLSDDNAPDKIRHKVMDLGQKTVAACFIGTDGVEDSFSRLNETEGFYKSFAVESIDKIQDEKFEEWIPGILNDLTVRGSGDDVSVAGFMDLDTIEQNKQLYKKQINAFAKESNLSKYREKLNSMERKDNILREKVKATRDEKDLIEYLEYHVKYYEIEKKIEELTRQ